MKKNTYNTIISEINQTGQVSKKLLLSLTAPIVIKMFYNLFGPNGTHSLSEKTYSKILNELKAAEHELPTLPVPYASATLIQLFYDKIGQYVTSESIFEENHDELETVTDDLTVDDLLDLLNFANEDEDEDYAEHIKNRLTQMCSFTK